MTEEVGKKVCEGTVADLMKDKTGKQTVITLTRKNAYRVKKIREQGTDDEAVLFHFRKRCTGMGSYVHTIETADGETERREIGFTQSPEPGTETGLMEDEIISPRYGMV